MKPKRAKRPRAAKAPVAPSRGRPVFWSGDAIRRACDAMRESGSSDWLVLARKALEAAIRDEADLLAMMDSAPGRTPPKRTRVPAEAAAFTQM